MPNIGGKLARARDRGVTSVEFAVTASAFRMLLLGIFYLAMTLWAYANMQYAVEAAARCSRVNSTVCLDGTHIQAYATSLYYGPGSPVFTYETGACGNLVTAAFTFAWNLPLIAISVPLSAVACFP
jgi:Flp pilus assembly protein TadG